MYDSVYTRPSKIVDYYMVCDNEIKSFEEVIREKLEEGFQPEDGFDSSGSFCIDNQCFYYKAMVKYED